MKTLIRILLIMTAALLMAQTPVAPAQGVGSAGDPYRIATWQNLYWISQNSGEWNKHYLQTADIDFSDADPAITTWDSNQGWTPVGTDDNRFSGSYNGQDFVIDGLYVNRPGSDYAGFFGRVAGASAEAKAEIKDLGILNADISGRNYVAAIAGFLSWHCSLSNAYMSGSISASGENAGGLVGTHFSSNSYSITSTIRNAYYNFETSLINGEQIITTGALFADHFDDWIGNGKTLDIDDYLMKDIEDNYIISSLNDLKCLLAFGQFPEYDFILSNDLDLSSLPGLYIPYFCGSFNGNDKVIRNLNLDHAEISQMGLFGYLHGALVENLGLENAYVNANSRAGGMAGITHSSVIRHSYCTGGTINGNYVMGGFTGDNCYGSTLSDVFFTGTVSGHTYVGGLAGLNRVQVMIQNAYGHADVSGVSSVGGLVGRSGPSSSLTTIKNSFSKGTVSASGTSAGGLVGENYSSGIENAYSTAYTTRISGSNTYFGGFVGYNRDGKVYKSYSTGWVKFSGASPEIQMNRGFFGGISGNCVMEDNFWDTETSGASSTSGTAEGKTTSQMKTEATFTDAGWDFISIWSMDADINNGYPYFMSNTPPPDTPLPISLAGFKADAMNGVVYVTWVTESETENLAFRVYRDGEMIAELDGAGTTSEPQSYSWTDNYVVPGQTYSYVLADVTVGTVEVKHTDKAVSVTALEGDVAKDFAVGPAYPNPFNPVTVVPLNLAKDAQVHARLYDMLGRSVQELHKGTLAIGSHTLRVDGSMLSTGIYFVHVNVNNAVHVQKIALMK